MDSVSSGIELNSQPLAMSRVGKHMIVGCMDNTLRSYTTKVNHTLLPHTYKLLIFSFQYVVHLTN